MAEQAQDLAELVDCVVRPLVDYPDDLDIQSFDNEDGSVLIEIRVNADDAGKVIGRQGRVIKSIRTLARAAASKADTSVDVELVD